MNRFRLLPVLFLCAALGACAGNVVPETVSEPPPLPARQGPSFDELHAQALTAYKAKRYAQMEDLLRQAEAQRPRHPRALYNLAAARALQNDAAGALSYLQQLERMKLLYPVWDDPDFAALKGRADFQNIVSSFKKRQQPQGIANFAFSAGVNDFMPEGIAYDRDTGAFFLSSVRQRRVLRIDRNDERVPIVPAGTNGLMAALGMKIEPPTRRLWVATSALPVMEGYEDEDRGRAGIFAFDKDDGRLRGRYWLPQDGREHVIGDLIISSTAKIYATDSAGGQLYELDRSSGRYTALTARGAMESPQGLTFAPGQRYIYLADYHRGLLRFDLEQKKLEPLPGRDDVCLYGIDGLYYYKGALIAIQNGVRPNRVVRINLDETQNPPRVTGAQVLAASHEDFDEPTLGVVQQGGYLYFVANSHWNRVDENHRLPADSELTRPVVLRIDLDKKFGPETTK